MLKVGWVAALLMTWPAAAYGAENSGCTVEEEISRKAQGAFLDAVKTHSEDLTLQPVGEAWVDALIMLGDCQSKEKSATLHAWPQGKEVSAQAK